MELSLEGALIGASREQVFIRPLEGSDITISIRHAEALMLGLRDALQVADHLFFADNAGSIEQPLMPESLPGCLACAYEHTCGAASAPGMFGDIQNLIDACEKPAA